MAVQMVLAPQFVSNARPKSTRCPKGLSNCLPPQELIASLLSNFPDFQLGDGISADEAGVIDGHGTVECRRLAREADVTASMT
jgi:hypothetical protein